MAVKKAAITRAVAARVLAVVDKGLIYGMDDGAPDRRTWENMDTADPSRPKPGHMCVEAAVCYAMGEPHSDEPSCVAPFVREWKIALNDECDWATSAERARGLRRLAIAQLGSRGVVRRRSFVAAMKRRTSIGSSSYSWHPNGWSTNVTGLALGSLSRRQRFAICEAMVQALKTLQSPGTKFLSLAPLPSELRPRKKR